MNLQQHTIRPAAGSDLDSLARIDLLSHAQWAGEQFRSELDLPFSRTWVAETDGSITGFIVVRYILPDVEIMNIAVHPGSRRKGLARELVNTAIKSLMYNGHLKVFLEVREKNTTARTFYASLGFREISVRKNYYPDDNAVVLEAEFVL